MSRRSEGAIATIMSLPFKFPTPMEKALLKQIQNNCAFLLLKCVNILFTDLGAGRKFNGEKTFMIFSEALICGI